MSCSALLVFGSTLQQGLKGKSSLFVSFGLYQVEYRSSWVERKNPKIVLALIYFATSGCACISTYTNQVTLSV